MTEWDHRHFSFDRRSGLPHGYFDHHRGWGWLLWLIPVLWVVLALVWWDCLL